MLTQSSVRMGLRQESVTMSDTPAREHPLGHSTRRTACARPTKSTRRCTSGVIVAMFVWL